MFLQFPIENLFFRAEFASLNILLSADIFKVVWTPLYVRYTSVIRDQNSL